MCCALIYDRIVATVAALIGHIGRALWPGQYSFIEFPVDSSSPPSHIQQTLSQKTVQKLNPFIHFEAEEDLQENADILDDTEGEDEFDDFIDNCEVASEREPPTARQLINDPKRDVQRDGEVAGEGDEDLDDNEQEYSDEEHFSDNNYPLTAAAISHQALVSHDDMEQWRLLLDGYEETAAMVLGNKLLTAGTHFAPSVKSIIGRVLCPGWVFIESDGAYASKLCANVSNIYPQHIHPIVEDLQRYLHEPLVAPKEGDWVRLNSPLLYHGDLAYVCAYNNTSPNCLTTKQKNLGGEGAEVLVIPQAVHFVNRTKGKGRAGRPPQQVLEHKDAIQLFGADAVKAHDKDELTLQQNKN
ncbi:hypothetical protein DXG01_002456 [Tephrocybe rancida]|nr:hypothetical protein DXG01_002456 [Tephrocybe rancida]